jgi:hypothetical protein
MSAALSPQVGKRGSEDPYHADVIGIEQVADLVVAGLLCGREQGDAGIVDKNIQLSEMCVRLLNHLLHLLGLCHVKGEGKNSVAETSREIGNVVECER